jgi:hypothetical protein
MKCTITAKTYLQYFIFLIGHAANIAPPTPPPPPAQDGPWSSSNWIDSAPGTFIF